MRVLVHSLVTRALSYQWTFQVLPWMDAARDSTALPFIIVAVYLTAVFAGQAAMVNRQKFTLRTALAAWNLILCAFSWAGVYVTVPHLVRWMATNGVRASLCASDAESFRSGPPAFWVTMFMLSKIPELFDTAFIVLRKKPLTFLHVYHHSSVLVYCWLAFGWRSNMGLPFTAMNLCVHGVMYGYFFLSELGYKPIWGSAVTILQIVQMVAGCVICGAVVVWQFKEGQACEDWRTVAAGCVLYSSYLALFIDFFAKKLK